MKRSIFRQIGLLLLINLALIFSAFGKNSWLELQTGNFDIAGDVSEVEIRAVAQKLENFHQTFGQVLPKTRFEVPFRTKVILLKDEAELSLYQISDQYFLSANDANYAVLSINNSGSFENFYGNYAKFLLENNVGRNYLPAWLFEGLAEHLQTINIKDEQNFEFENSLKNINILRTSRLIPVDVLLETDHFTLRNQPEERKQIYRAEVWALLRYLLKETGDLAGVEKFIELKKRGINDSKAMAEAFQTTPARIKEDFPKFLEIHKFEAQSLRSTEKISLVSTWKTTQITQAKWLSIQADYFFYANRFPKSESLIEKSLKIEPNQNLALTTLALIKAGRFYYDEAEKLAEKAIENEPENFLNHYRYALALGRRGMTEYGFVSGYNASLANQMQESVKRSIDLNPNFTESYALLAFVNAVRNESLDESIGFIKQALQIAPGNHQYQLRLAELNLRKEKFGEARKLALQVLQNTESEGVKLYAQNTIQRIDATEFQLEGIRNKNAKYVNQDIVTDQPLSDDEIKKLREKATNDQIRAILQRPAIDEKRVFGSLARIECGKDKVNFLVKTQTGLLKFYSNSLDRVRLLSLVEEMSDYRLNCGAVIRDNNAAIIIKNAGEIVSIEFIPKGFK